MGCLFFYVGIPAQNCIRMVEGDSSGPVFKMVLDVHRSSVYSESSFGSYKVVFDVRRSSSTRVLPLCR